LGLVPPRARQDAREILRMSDSEFDGTRLVDLCLEGRASDGDQTLPKAMLSLRSRLIGLETAAPRRRRPSFVVRTSATMTAKLIFFSIYTFLILVVVFLVKRNWPSADVYAVGDKLLSYFKF